MILKMNFNFNFKDIPPSPNPSIRGLTTARDYDHTVELPHRMASGCSERLPENTSHHREKQCGCVL
jgi:hypothetical protein